MKPFKPSYFEKLGEDFLKSAQGQHYSSTFTARELAILMYLEGKAETPDALEHLIQERFGCIWKEGSHGTHSYIVVGAMFGAWIEEMLRWECERDA